jgi:hypothetical protein
MRFKSLINEKSAAAALVMTGLNVVALKHDGEKCLEGYNGMGTLLFVLSHDQKEIS